MATKITKEEFIRACNLKIETDRLIEQERIAKEEARKREEERKRKEEEEARRKAEEERKRREEEARKRKEEEDRKKREEEEERKRREEVKRRAEEERKRKAQEEAKKRIDFKNLVNSLPLQCRKGFVHNGYSYGINYSTMSFTKTKIEDSKLDKDIFINPKDDKRQPISRTVIDAGEPLGSRYSDDSVNREIGIGRVIQGGGRANKYAGRLSKFRGFSGDEYFNASGEVISGSEFKRACIDFSNIKIR